MSTAHIQTWLILIFLIIPTNVFHSYQYSDDKKKIKVEIESNRSARCHVTPSWRRISLLLPPPVRKEHVPLLWETERPNQSTPYCRYTCRQRCRSCSVLCFFKTESVLNTVFSNANVELYKTMTYPCFNMSICFVAELPTLWRFGICFSESSLVFWWSWYGCTVWKNASQAQNLMKQKIFDASYFSYPGTALRRYFYYHSIVSLVSVYKNLIWMDRWTMPMGLV